jgi:CrcB protein
MLKILAVMIGAAVRSLSRYLQFLATLMVASANLSACTHTANRLAPFASARLRGFLADSRLTSESRLFIFTGLVGGMTTFSTFTLPLPQLFKAGEWPTICVTQHHRLAA